MSAETGFPWLPAPCPSNNLTIRLEAVRQPLSRNIDGHPGFLLSPTCTVLRRGFNSGYRYKKLQVSGADRYGDTPDKNEFSHPHDGLQYLSLGGGEYYEVMGLKAARDNGPRQTRAIDDDHPQGQWTPGGTRQTVVRE